MKYRRLLSFVLAMLMVMSLLPVSALAAGGKSSKSTVDVKESATIAKKTVKVTLKSVPKNTTLKVSGVKKSAYKDAVSSALGGQEFETVLAMKINVSPKLKSDVKAVVTASEVKGKNASDLRLFRISNGKAKEIKGFSISGKDLKFKDKAFGVIVLVKPVVAAPTPEPVAPVAPATEAPAPAAPAPETPVEEPAQVPAREPTEEPTQEPTEEPTQEPT